MIVWPGLRRSVSAISRLFNSASFVAPLTHSAIPTRAASGTTATFTRATTATVRDNEGVLRTAIAGEARFEGARRVRNLLTFTEDFSNAVWSATGLTKTATTLTEQATSADHSVRYTVASGKNVFQIKVKPNGRTRCALASTGSTLKSAIFNLTTASVEGALTDAFTTLGDAPTITLQSDGYYLLTMGNLSGSSTLVDFYMLDETSTARSYAGDITKGMFLKQAQLEDVTAQTTQTAGEYVSVGALDYRSTNDPLYLSLPGTNGHCATTPDSAAASPTGDIELIFDGAATDWTPTADQVLICKDDAGVQRDILLFLRLATARVELWTSATGASYAGRAASATAALPFADGQRGQIKVTRSAATGDTNFYTSTDGGGTWAQLGTTVSTTAGAIHDGSAGITVGAIGDASKTAPFGGKIYNATLATSIGGTPVVDFNPHRDATTPTGTITSSTTGEVWTINGASSVVRNAAYHGSMVDGVKCFPTDLSGNPIPSTTMLGYLAEGARTNLCLQSNDPSNASWTKSAFITTTQNVVSPDGATNAWTITATAGATFAVFLQNITVTADTNSYTASCFVNKTTGTPATYPMFELQHSSATKTAGVVINTTAGTLTNRSVGGAIVAPDAKTITSWNDDYWRVTVTLANNSGTTSTIAFYPSINSDGTGVIVSGTLGSAVFYGAQVELGSFASSYIPTTTIAVARNADVLTYPSTGNISGTVGAAYAEVARGVLGTGANSRVISTTSGANTGPLLLEATTGQSRIYDGTTFATSGLGGISISATNKIASRWGGSAMQVAIGGVAGTVQSFDGDLSPTIVIVGSDTVAGDEVFGTIRNVRIWQRALSSSELQAITS